MNRVRCESINPDCPYSTHYQDRHHLAYPKAEYRTTTERDYRSLSENIIRLCRYEHEVLHHTELPPTKPTPGAMRLAIRRAGNELPQVDSARNS